MFPLAQQLFTRLHDLIRAQWNDEAVQPSAFGLSGNEPRIGRALVPALGESKAFQEVDVLPSDLATGLGLGRGAFAEGGPP